MDKFFPRIHANANRPESPRLRRQASNHQAMHFQQIVNGIWIDLFKDCVCGFRVLHFLNFLRRAKHALAVDYVGHLLQRQRVLLDGKRRMNGLKPVLLPEKRVYCTFAHFKVRRDLCYFGDK